MAKLDFDGARYALERGANGERQAMLATLGDIAQHLRADTLPETYRLWLADALEAIAQGEQADKALLLNRGRGGRKGDMGREIEIAHDVHGHPGGQHKQPGGAYYEVAKQWRRSPSAVERIYAKWRKAFEVQDELND